MNKFNLSNTLNLLDGNLGMLIFCYYYYTISVIVLTTILILMVHSDKSYNQNIDPQKKDNKMRNS